MMLRGWEYVLSSVRDNGDDVGIISVRAGAPEMARLDWSVGGCEIIAGNVDLEEEGGGCGGCEETVDVKVTAGGVQKAGNVDRVRWVVGGVAGTF